MNIEPGVLGLVCNLGTQEAETGGFGEFPDSLGYTKHLRLVWTI